MAEPSPRAPAGGGLDHAFLPLLAAVYVAATLAPAPAWLARLPLPQWLDGADGAGLSTSKLILAGLLFVAGMRMAVTARPQAPWRAVGGLVRVLVRVLGLAAAGRLAPLAAMVGLSHLLAAAAVPAVAMDVATGLLLVAAMPSANTSTAWTRRSGGSLPLCVGLVLVTTLAAPLVVPTAAALAAGPAAAMTGDDQRAFAGLGLDLLAWVVLPMAAGLLAGRLAGGRAAVPLAAAGSIGPLAAILALNYLNASRGLPQLLGAGQLLPLVASAATGAALVAMTFATGWLVARTAGLAPEPGLAVAYAVGMSNTGLAGTLANAAFPDRAVILYPIVLCTLAQHVMAALIDATRRRSPASPVSENQSPAAAPGRAGQ